MKFWQSFFLSRHEQYFGLIKLCEEVGFDGATVSDHILHFENLDSLYLYSEDGKPPSFTAQTVWPESWSIIAALAAMTERLQFATNVYVLPLRHPVEVAKATASVASFAEGRLIFGAGSGWMKEEFDVLGVDFATRGRRFDEGIEVCRKLWTGRVVEHHGEFFDFDPTIMCPVPSQPIPIYIGGTSGPALRRTARLGDGWIGPGQTLEDAIRTLRQIDVLRAEAGRSQEPFDTIVPLVEPPDLDTLKRLEDAGAGGTISYPFFFTVSPTATLDESRAYLEGYGNNVIAKMRS